MAEQAGRGRGRGDPARTEESPIKEPYYEGYFGSEEEEGVERTAEVHEEPEAPREDPGGTGEGAL